MTWGQLLKFLLWVKRRRRLSCLVWSQDSGGERELMGTHRCERGIDIARLSDGPYRTEGDCALPELRFV